MSIVYQIDNFSFSYPHTSQMISLHGKLQIYHGDCILLQGNSGSGKSTLLASMKGMIPHLINGRLKGKILYHGTSITDLSEQDLLSVGYLQQNPDSQLICQDVYSELAFGLENQRLPSITITTKIKEISERFGIETLLNRSVKDLSGGEKQKINLLAILLMEPEVLLLDEPTAFLDPSSATQIISIIANYLKNKTVIIIEHNLHYLQPLVNRVIQINQSGVIKEALLTEMVWQQALDLGQNTSIAIQKAKPNLTIHNLSFAYPFQNYLFTKLNLAVSPGEIVAISGSNGSGKSTLLKLISKIIQSKQQIFWQNQDINEIKRNRFWSEISLLWQNPEAHFIYESVEKELAVKPSLLSEFNLEAQGKLSPFSLSEGQKRRLSLAITLNKTSKLILLDEPTFGQDFYNKELLAKIIVKLAKEGISFIIVSHDLLFIKAIAHTNYQLIQGKFMQC